MNKKIVAILATNVEVSTALNVIGHLAVAIGKYSGIEIMGSPILKDKSGVKHLGIGKFPFIATKVKMGKLKTAIEKAKQNSKAHSINSRPKPQQHNIFNDRTNGHRKAK